MKKFKFRLEALLKLRQQAEDEKKRMVGQLLSEINEQQREALEMDVQLQREGDILKEQYLQGNVDLDWVSHYRGFVISTQNAINQRIEKVVQIQGKMSHARKELADAAREKKILEKLKEKKQKRYDAELQRLELLAGDELATQLYLNNRQLGVLS